MSKSSGEIEKILEKRASLIDYELSLISYALEPPQLADVVRYAISQKGKRLRSTVLTLSCEAVGGNIAQAMVPAVIVEMIHNTSLILDDIIDASETRRGKATINARWGNHMALIACDAMLALAIKQASKSGIEVTKSIIECSSNSLLMLAEGEALELAGEYFTVNDYFKIASKKTASLFSVACEVGSLVGGGNKKEINALKRYGENLGIAFQIKDDILDFTANEYTLGKPLFIDLKMNRPTLVMILALKSGLTRDDMLKMDHSSLCKVLEPSLSEADRIASEKIKEARKNLNVLKDTEAKEYLDGICDYVIQRTK